MLTQSHVPILFIYLIYTNTLTGNESFTKLIKQPSSSSSSSQQDTNTNNNNLLPLTIFEIVDSKSLPSLYSMLAMALHNVSIVDVEDFTLVESVAAAEDEVVGDKRKRMAAKEEDSTTSSSHLSITLPCKSFHGTRTRYNITVSSRYACICTRPFSASLCVYLTYRCFFSPKHIRLYL